jgi:hypothetical protein
MELDGGLPELLTDDENGCIVPPGAIAEMAEVIADLHRDRPRLARLKTAARHTLRTRADPAAHATWLLERLDALWQRPDPAPALVADPDPLGARVDRLVEAARSTQPASIAIWGAGVVGRQIADRLLTAGITPLLMVDADPIRHGTYRGISVAAPTALSSPASMNGHSPAIVCVGSVAFADEIIATLRQQPTPPRVLVP